MSSPYLLGRLPAQRPIGLRTFDHYTTVDYVHPVPLVLSEEVPPPSVEQWGMLGNGPDPTLTVHHGVPVGDCTVAGVAHLRMAVAARYEESEPPPTADAVVEAYLTMTHGADTGLTEASVLNCWYQAGLLGNKCLGYAPLPHEGMFQFHLRRAVAEFGGVYLGVALPASAQVQFANHEPWDVGVIDRDILGGHCVVAVGYDPQYLYVVTWGTLQPVSWRWWRIYGEEAWVVLTTERVTKHVDLAALQADLAQL